MDGDADAKPKCGTYGGYQRHKRRRETPCEECRLANNDYAREYRAARPAVVKSDRKQTLARMRALSRLAAAHPTEYQMLYEDEMVELGPQIQKLRATYKKKLES